MSPAIASLDARIFRLVYAAWGARLTGVAVFLSAIGSGWTILAILPFYASRWRRFALTLTGALLATASVVFVIKHAVERSRPFVALADVQPLTTPPSDPSFPSGHASGCFTFAFFVLFVLNAPGPRPLCAARAVLSSVLVLLAASIAWSRVYLGVHFPGDVTAGALLGALSGSLWARAYVHRRDRVPA